MEESSQNEEKSKIRTTEDYSRELSEDNKMTRDNLREKSLMVTSIRAKWLSYYFSEKRLLERLDKGRSKILNELNTSISYSDLKCKQNDILSKNDPRIKKIDEYKVIVKGNIEFIERAMNILIDLVWSVKNNIELMKLEKI